MSATARPVHPRPVAARDIVEPGSSSSPTPGTTPPRRGGPATRTPWPRPASIRTTSPITASTTSSRTTPKLIAALPTKPILIGHSFGGMIAQKLLGEDRAVAAVAIDAAQIKGVLPLPLSALRATLPVFKNPANKHRAVSLTRRAVPLRLRQRDARRRSRTSCSSAGRSRRPASRCSRRPRRTSTRIRRPRWTPTTRAAGRCC